MNLEELQDAIDNAQSNNLYIPLPIMDAARLVAAVLTEGLAERVHVSRPMAPIEPN